MKLKSTLVFIQRLVIVELEAIILILSVQMLLKFFNMPDMSYSYCLWLQILFVLTSLPMFYLDTSRKMQYWTASTLIFWIITGIWMEIMALWLPIILGIWRSISVVKLHEYLIATYIRVIFGLVLLVIYFMISHLINAPVWWAISLLATGSFGFFILGISCHNLVEHYREQPKREDWIRVCRNQLLFVIFMMMVVIFFVIFKNKFISLVVQVCLGIGKLLNFIITPLIILLSNVITYLYSIIAGSNKETSNIQLGFGEILKTAKVNENASNHGFISIFLSTICIFGLLVLLAFIIKKFFYYVELKQERVDDWIEIVEQNQKPDKKGHLFSAFKNLNIFASNQKVDPIRLLYRDFLKQYYQRVKVNNQDLNSTTRDIVKRAEVEFPLNIEDLQTLTRVYEEHRYGSEPPNSARINKMKKSVENWLKS